jgi:hypothetical protein
MWSAEIAVRQSRKFAHGSVLRRLAPAKVLEHVAFFSPPRSLFKKGQLMRPIAASPKTSVIYGFLR